MCKKIFFTLLLLNYVFNVNAQIYSTSKEIEFEVIQYVNNKDSIKESMTLTCKGVLWKFLSDEGKIITEDNNWSIDWIYNSKKGLFEYTGVFENKNQIFLHPPRSEQYEILEYCPFPQIQFPVTDGKTWSYDLEIGEIWSKAIKNNVKGKTIVTNKYTVVGKILWYNPFLKKNIDCYEIQATGHTKFGKTYLQAYFSDTYGFVYLNFTTLNKDKFVFRIKSIKSTSTFQLQKWY